MRIQKPSLSLALLTLAVSSLLTLTSQATRASNVGLGSRRIQIKSLTEERTKRNFQESLVYSHRYSEIIFLKNFSVALAQTSLLGGMVILIGVASGVGIVVFLCIEGIVRVESDEVGIVRKKFGRPTSHLIALNSKEVGWQADILAPGIHWCFPWLHEVYKEKAIYIGPDKIGIVEAKDGHPLKSGQNFSKAVECKNFQDAQAFFKEGQRGNQLTVLNQGTYRINTKLFSVRISDVVHIDTDQVGIVKAKDGASLPLGQNFGKSVECNDFQDAQLFISNGGQRGNQLAILKAGTYQINTDFFSIKKVPIVKILPGEIGLVIAQDGNSLSDARILGRVVECNNFQDANSFISHGGQRGKQLAILRTGKYQINTDLFTIITTANAHEHGMRPEELKVYIVGADMIGIVTAYDGRSLSAEEIAGPIVKGHNKFQDGQEFIDAGGYKGLQEEFLQEGSWSLNPWFVDVEQISLTEIFSDQVGVVTSYIGQKQNTAFDDQSRLVDEGFKGIQKIPLPPGRYPINKRVQSIEIVPTNSIVLEWSSELKPADNYDVNLKTLELRSQDAFEFEITVTQVICIDVKDAPKMVLRAGAHISKNLKDESSKRKKNDAIKNLVAKILGPMIDNYFQDAAQGFEALDFLAKRSQIQAAAAEHIGIALNEAGVQALGTFINIADFPKELEKQLKERKVLEQERQTFAERHSNELLLQELIEQQEITKSQPELVEVKKQLEIARINAQAFIAERTAEVKAQQLSDNADAARLERERDIDARYQERLRNIEINELKQKVLALSPDLYAKIQSDKAWSQALSQLKIDMPEVFIGGGNGNPPVTDALQAGTMQFAWMDMLRDMIKQREPKPINPSSEVELISPDTENPDTEDN